MKRYGNIMDDYYRATMFQQTEEFEPGSWSTRVVFPGSCESNSQDGPSSSTTFKNTVSERNRRKKLGDRLLDLREAVPKISKLDRASIIKDAINYIEALQREERSIETEIMELESLKFKQQSAGSGSEQELPVLLRTKKRRMTQTSDGGGFQTSRIQVLQLKTAYIREKTVQVSLVCTRRTDTILKLSELFESLKLNISASTITTVAERVLKTVFIEADEEDEDSLKEKIQRAIADADDLEIPVLM